MVATIPETRAKGEGRDELRDRLARLLHDLRWALATPAGDRMAYEPRLRWIRLLGRLEREIAALDRECTQSPPHLTAPPAVV